LTEVGTTPVLSFAAPSLGDPDYYEIEIVDTTDLVTATGDLSRNRLVARITTRSTEVRVPAAVLRPARWYCVRLTAIQNGGRLSEPSIYPSMYFDSTQMLSGYLTP